MNNTTNSNNFVTKSVSNADYLAQPCIYFFVSLSATGEPILGTMFSKNNNQYDVKNGPCTEARLTTYQMKPGAGQKQCFFPSGFRYFYQVSTHNPGGAARIVPNSMIQISGQGKPPMCAGTHTYREFINLTPQRQPTD
jgi:hypothetical protein